MMTLVSLKGQWKAYLSAQLMDYQNGDRKAGKKMAKQLKEDCIRKMVLPV